MHLNGHFTDGTVNEYFCSGLSDDCGDGSP
jgi:hypothetical protein